MPPPAGTVGHTVRRSTMQLRTIMIRTRGANGGSGRSDVGCVAGAGGAAGAVAAARFGCGALRFGAGAV